MVSLPDRSQSETVGIVLLTVVVVVVTTTAGLFVLSDLRDRQQADRRADLSVTPTASGIVIEHLGGDEFNASRIDVVVRSAAGEAEFTLADGFSPVEGADDRFAPGDRWNQTTGGSYDGELTVLVVDTRRGRILEQTTAVVGATGLELSVDETRISDEGATSYTVTRTFEQDDTADVTDSANVTVGDESVLTRPESTTELRGNNTGTTTVTATFDGATSNTVEITVLEAGKLDVVGFSHDNPVTAGEVLNITVAVANPGETEATGAVRIQRRPGVDAGFGPTGLSRRVTLDGGERTTVEFDYEIERADAAADRFGMRAVTPDDPQGRGDAIETRLPQPRLRIDDLSVTTDPPLVAGRQLTANVTLRNTGERVADGERLNLSVGGQRTQTAIRGVAVGQTTDVTVSVTPQTAARGRNLTAETAADDRTIQIDVLEPPQFTVRHVSVVGGSPLVGETVRLNATVENTGGVAGTQTVTLDPGPLALAPTDGEQELTLTPGTETNVTLTATATAPGSGSITVESADDSNSTTVQIREPPYFDLREVPQREAVTAGVLLPIEFDVANTGDVAQTQQIELNLDGSVVDSTNLKLAPGEQRQVTLNYDTEGADVGIQQLTISTANESTRFEVDVQDPFGDVTILSTNEPVEEGEKLRVTVKVTKLELIDVLVFRVNDRTIDVRSAQNGEVTLTWQTERGDAGENTVTVELSYFLGLIDQESDTTTVTVTKPTLSVIDLQSSKEAVAGGSVTANATVANDGLVTTEQQVELRIGDDPTGAPENYTVLASRAVELGAGTQTTVAFESVSVPSSLAAGTRSIGIVTQTDGSTASIEVSSPGDGTVGRPATGGLGVRTAVRVRPAT